MPNRIVPIEERVVYADPDNKWVKLYFDRVRFPNGNEGYYNKLVENEGKLGVVILPIANDAICLVRQFRYPINKEVWEVPRGFGETGDAKADAAREFSEETGINISHDKLVHLGILHPNSGLLSSEVNIFAALFNFIPSVPQVSDSEVSKLRWVKYKDLLSMIEGGEVNDVFTMAALLRAQIRKLLPAV